MIDVDNEVKSIIAEELGVDMKDVIDGADLVEKLGADSLDIVELKMKLEEHFNIVIPDEDAEKTRTVGETISYIKNMLAENV